MKEINMLKFDDNVKVHYTNKKISLAKEYSKRVQSHWESLLNTGKKLFNGDVFTIYKIKINGSEIHIYVGLTNYAHFLYTMHKNNYEDDDCRIIHTSVLIETIDNKFAIGEMNECTAFPFKLQFIGGGIDKEDISGEFLNLEHNIKKEILEELGIQIENKDIVKKLKPCYLKSGGKRNFLSAIFKLDLLINEEELAELLNIHNKDLELKMEMQEIRNLIFINSDKESIREFVTTDKRERDENLIATLEAAVGIRTVSDYYSVLN
ncbi:NUDIX hydrolase [Clostridium sp. DL-VIII]|uniref:NUDIX hydrolase n=1 Tax=Clostridium sp. DL-VIII TaxID=641107 RepID=UPI00023AF775|nr:NUDIX hydrolase [Clostridium sp. DL-VIII]EHI96849.1 NUDIX hydrolase [Clostridium sp. DL-VIII]